jgi:hypothetical protein
MASRVGNAAEKRFHMNGLRDVMFRNFSIRRELLMPTLPTFPFARGAEA